MYYQTYKVTIICSNSEDSNFLYERITPFYFNLWYGNQKYSFKITPIEKNKKTLFKFHFYIKTQYKAIIIVKALFLYFKKITNNVLSFKLVVKKNILELSRHL